MKRLLMHSLATLALLAVHGTAFAQSEFLAKLTGPQEVPPVATAATGSATFTLTDAGLQFYITVDGISGPITGAHFHQGRAGTSGGVVRTITEFSGHTAQGIWTPTDAQPLTTALLEELQKDGLYVNIHTAANPAGEIRGQVEPAGGVHLTAVLSGSQENPPVAGGGSGVGTFVIKEKGVQYDITVTGLSGGLTASHIHTGAIGVNGGVLFDLTPSFSGNSAHGFVALTPTQKSAMIAGDMYVNVHTGLNPGGEIRGQILLAGGNGNSASLTGAQEVPPTGSGATATASLTLTPAGLQFDITATGLSGPITGAHFHNAAAGANGPVVRGITAEFGGGTTASGLWSPDDAQPLTPTLVAELLAGNIYLNLHTGVFPAGEIRGQVTLNPGPVATTFTATMTGDQEEPPVAGGWKGTGNFVLTPGGLAYAITVDGLSGPITAAHFHAAGIGVNGGVVQAITGSFVGNTAAGVWAIGAADITQLLLGNIYINVHTGAHPAGELRGQLVPASGAELDGSLTGSQEVPPTASAGQATASYRLTREGLVFNFAADGLTGAITAAHFHSGQRGVGGGVVRGLAGSELTGNIGAGVWKPSDPSPLTAALMADLLRGGIYLNLHTAVNPGGEIRAQTLLAGGDGRSALLIGGAEVPPVGVAGMGTASAILTDMGIVFRTTVSDLTGAFTAAHFHNAPPGTNGPVVRDLMPNFIGQTGDGVWMATDPTPPTNLLIQAFVLGNIYENIHTSVYPSGETRGWFGRKTPSAVDQPLVLADGVRLYNTPNPVTGSTTVRFYLPQKSEVSLKVYDVGGREISTMTQGARAAGWQQASFDASRLPQGVYLYRLDAGALTATKKMLVVR